MLLGKILTTYYIHLFFKIKLSAYKLKVALIIVLPDLCKITACVTGNCSLLWCIGIIFSVCFVVQVMRLVLTRDL